MPSEAGAGISLPGRGDFIREILGLFFFWLLLFLGQCGGSVAGRSVADPRPGPGRGSERGEDEQPIQLGPIYSS